MSQFVSRCLQHLEAVLFAVFLSVIIQFFLAGSQKRYIYAGGFNQRAVTVSMAQSLPEQDETPVFHGNEKKRNRSGDKVDFG